MQLRFELSAQVQQAIDQATSSEAMVAIRRAAVEGTLDLIHAYETHLGVSQGAATTEWSVLTDADLGALRERALADTHDLELRAQGSPGFERAPELELRRSDVVGTLRGIDGEIARRATGPPPAPEIAPDVTVADARGRFPEIDRLEQRGATFEAKLRVQVALRSHRAPRDAALASLQRAMSPLPDVATASAESVTTRVAMQTAARPPPRVVAAADDVKNAIWEELDATRRRDPIAIADARARQTVGTEWLQASLGEGRGPVTRWIPVSSDALLVLRAEYVGWHARLAAEAGVRLGEPDVALQLEDARATIAEIDGELQRRHFPRAPETIAPDLAEERGAQLAVLDRRMKARLEKARAFELARQAERPRPIPDTRVARAQRAAVSAAVAADVTALRKAWDQLDAFGRDTLIHARGAVAAERAGQWRAARELLIDARAAVAAELDMLTLRDPRLAGALRVQLAPIPHVRAARGPTVLAEALLAVERLPVPGTVVTARPPTIGLIIDDATDGRTKVDLLSPSQPRARGGAATTPADSYGALFPEGEAWTRDHKGLTADPRKAPGGIVIDVRLPPSSGRTIDRAEVDPATGAIRVRIAGTWSTVSPGVDAATARAAWGYVLDRRVAAVDIRPLTAAELVWLVQSYSPVPFAQLSAREQQELMHEVRLVTSANLHPALVDTAIGTDLIFADMVVFDLLIEDVFAIEGDEVRFGLDVRSLWTARARDRRRQQTDDAFGQAPFIKSLLSVTRVQAARRGAALALTTAIDPGLFVIPLEGSAALPRSLPDSTRWLSDHAVALRSKVPALRRLAAFAVTVALLRSLEERGVSHNFDVLVGVAGDVVTTPRMFCRSSATRQCNRTELARRLGISSAPAP